MTQASKFKLIIPANGTEILVSLICIYVQDNVYKNLILKAQSDSSLINYTLWSCWDAIYCCIGDPNDFMCTISSNWQWDLGREALHHFRLETWEDERNYMFWDSPTAFSYYWRIRIVLAAKGFVFVPKPQDTWHWLPKNVSNLEKLR